MSAKSSCKLHSKYGTTPQINTPEIGVAGVVRGAPTYSPGKFDNGFETAYVVVPTINTYFTNPGNDPNAFAFTIWVKPGVDVISGDPQDGNRHGIFALTFPTTSDFIQLTMNGVGNSTQLGVRVGGVMTTYTITTGLNMTAGTLYGLSICFDRTHGVGGTINYMKLYLDEVEIFASAARPANQPLAVSQLTINSVYNSATYTFSIDGVLDNPKLFDLDGTQQNVDDINDNINFEGFLPSAPINIVATDGTFTSHVKISWDDGGDADEYKVWKSLDDITYTAISGWIAATTYNDSLANPGITYYYKIQAKNDAGESALSVSDTGYRAILIGEPLVYDDTSRGLVLSDGLDVTKRMRKLIPINERKTYKRDKMIINEVNIHVDNFDDYFSVGNPSSPFQKIRWRFDECRVYDEDNEIIWDGIIYDIERDHKTKTAIIISVDPFYKFQKKKIAYTSSDWETPGEAVQNIFIQEGFTNYNKAVLDQSIIRQQENGCYIKCNILMDDDITFQQTIEKLGEIGVADVYSHKNEVYYQHWKPYTGGIKIKLSDADLKDVPRIRSDIQQLMNDYNIRYDGDEGVAATDSNSNIIGLISRQDFGTQDVLEIDGSDENQIVIRDKIAAIYIGESLMQRTHIGLRSAQPQPPDIIKFNMPIKKNSNWIDLQTFFSLTLPDEGWEEEIFEVYEFTIDIDRNNIAILAYKVQT